MHSASAPTTHEDPGEQRDSLARIAGRRGGRAVPAKLFGIAQILVPGDVGRQLIVRRGVTIEERQLTAPERTVRQLVENCQRKGLSSLEIARALKELMAESSMSAAEAAAACGFKETFVSKVFTVLESPDSVQSKVASGQLALSTAYEIVKLPDAGRRAELAEEAVNGKLTRRAVQQRIKKGTKQSRKRAKRPPIPTAVADLGGGRSITARGPGLSRLDTLIAWFEETLDGLRRALAGGCDLASLGDFFKEQNALKSA